MWRCWRGFRRLGEPRDQRGAAAQARNRTPRPRRHGRARLPPDQGRAQPSARGRRPDPVRPGPGPAPPPQRGVAQLRQLNPSRRAAYARGTGRDPRRAVLLRRAGPIVAVSARRLGAPFDITVESCTVVGDDRESDEAVARLLSAGVGAGGTLRDPAGHLPRCVVLVEPSGRRTILGSRSTQFPPGLRLRLDRLTGRSRDTVIHVEGHYLDTCLPIARDLAAERRVLTMDTTGLPALQGTAAGLATLTHVFRLVFVSRTQARRIAPGLPDEDLPEALAAALAA